jgi:hypothetical protein
VFSSQFSSVLNSKCVKVRALQLCARMAADKLNSLSLSLRHGQLKGVSKPCKSYMNVDNVLQFYIFVLHF